jgi:S-adenosylmethionine decarboxylase
LESLGRHLLIELRDCDADVLQDLELVRTALLEAAAVAGATIVSEAFYQFAPFGISGMVIIAESHLSIHTWPEHRYAAADIFTCGELLQAPEAVDVLVNNFRSLNPTVMEVARGLLAPGETKIRHHVLAPEEVHS